MTPAKVKTAVRKLIQAGRPRRLYLFGSYVHRKKKQPNDLDVLVVVGDGVENTRQESVRLRDAVGDISMALDIVVVRESQFFQLRDAPGLIYREAVRSGRLIYESAS